MGLRQFGVAETGYYKELPLCVHQLNLPRP